MFNEKSLLEIIENTELPIPLYNSENPETRKQIGIVTELWIDDGGIGFSADLIDGKIIKGRYY